MSEFLVMLSCVALALVLARTIANLVDDRPLAKYKLSHWAQALPDLYGTSQQLYDAVSARIAAQQMPGVTTRVVAWRDGGLHAEKRSYLRIERGDLAYDLYVARFGTNLFVASWFCRNPTTFFEILAHLPIFRWLAWLWVKLFRWETYYRIDSRAMFQGAVHNCVLQVIDQMTTAQGAQALPELARRPALPELIGAR